MESEGILFNFVNVHTIIDKFFSQNIWKKIVLGKANQTHNME